MADIAISNVDKKLKDSEIPVILCNFTDVYYNWSITKEKCRQFMRATATNNEIEKFIIRQGDVAITKDSETRDDIGVSTYFDSISNDVLLGYHCALIRPNKSYLNGAYLNALLNTSYAKKYFAYNASGSGQRFSLSIDSINNFPIELPSLSVQLRITNILGTLDKRLELCRRITANLLKKLDELYDYYFGDGNQSKQNCFGHDFFEILSGYPFDSSTYSKGKYKIITIKSIKMNDFDTLTADCVETIPLSIDAKCVLTCGDILISLTGDTGRIAIVDEKDCLLNQRVGKILCEDEYKIYTYALLRSQYAQRYISKNSVGTSQKNISPIILSNIKTYLPDEDELKIFNSLAIPMFQKYVAEQERAKNIIQIKNSILPLLMNGQIQVIN